MWLLFVGFGDLVTLLHDVAFWHLEDLEYDIAKQVKWLPHGVVEQQCSSDMPGVSYYESGLGEMLQSSCNGVIFFENLMEHCCKWCNS